MLNLIIATEAKASKFEKLAYFFKSILSGDTKAIQFLLIFMGIVALVIFLKIKQKKVRRQLGDAIVEELKKHGIKAYINGQLELKVPGHEEDDLDLIAGRIGKNYSYNENDIQEIIKEYINEDTKQE